jgi:thiamine-phosphate pyrophosphorylase
MNLHRAEEALRTIEEVLAGVNQEAASAAASLRFEVYSLEKREYPVLAARDKRAKLEFDLYVVTGPAQSRGRGFEEVVRDALAGGAGAIQLRAKELVTRETLEVAKNLRALTADTGSLFVVNDHVDVALACGADGVHLGQNDLPIPEARRIVGPDLILGASCHSLEQALRAEGEGADYVNVGPIFATQTKVGGVAPVGVELIRTVKDRLGVPQTCMGGINAGNVAQVVRAGAERIAVVSAVVGAADVKTAAEDLVQRIREAKSKREE